MKNHPTIPLPSFPLSSTYPLLIVEQALTNSKLNDFISMVNDLRAKTGADPVCFNRKLMIAATLQSNNQYKMKQMNHVGPDGSSSFDRVIAVGFQNPTLVSENVAMGQNSITSVFQSWRDSSGHFRNMVDKSTTFIGLDKVGPFWTMTMANSRTETCLSLNEEFGSNAPRTASALRSQRDTSESNSKRDATRPLGSDSKPSSNYVNPRLIPILLTLLAIN